MIPLLLSEVPRHPELKNALSRPLANIQGIVSIIQRYQVQELLPRGTATNDCGCLDWPNYEPPTAATRCQ